MIKILELSKEPFSSRHGRYGGLAGDKDGIRYLGENWLVKYPKSTRGMAGNALASYTTSPLSEYIGSHIFEVLGFDTHQTALAYRNGQICVACKDFQDSFGDLAEARTLKNAANRQISALVREDVPLSITGDSVCLEEILFHFKVNPLFQIAGIQQRFWETAVVDILIENNDRNNGNWGLLYDKDRDGYKLAPIYDNGNSFRNKISESRIRAMLAENDGRKVFSNARTAYVYEGHNLSAEGFLSLDIPELKEAVLKLVPTIIRKRDDIYKIIVEIPEEYNGLCVCSKERKLLYKRIVDYQLDNVLTPTLHRIISENEQNKNTTR